MTALNAHAVGSRAYVVTDTAAYDLDGVVGAFVNKTLTIPHLRMVIATRGSVMALPDISVALTTRCHTFDDVLAQASSIIEETYHDRLVCWHDLCGIARIDVMLVGYSERQRKTVIGFLSSVDNPQFAAFEMYSPGVMLTPPPPEDRLRAEGILGPHGFNPRRAADDLLRVIELQRSVPIEMTPGDPSSARHVVGGHAVLTEISEAGITQRVMRTWGDKLFETIRPPEPLPAIAAQGTPASGMSRQQRRNAERLARKGAAHAA